MRFQTKTPGRQEDVDWAGMSEMYFMKTRHLEDWCMMGGRRRRLTRAG